MKTINELADDLASGSLTSREVVERSLEAISDPSGEGERAFLTTNDTQARAEADAWDERRKAGEDVPRFAGIPMAIKDLFDVAGEVTRAGSKVLNDAPPAKSDCPVIARLRAAGFIFIGRSNMVEFAFGGLGTNPHYGTPLSVYDREAGRVPGGSSSGSAVAVADDMAAISMGTDTGGSCRIPAAFNHLTGYKPSAPRVPKDGVFPLSFSLDSVGPIGRSVRCCASVDAILAEDWSGKPAPFVAGAAKLGVLQNFVLDDLDPEVANAYDKALDRLSQAGVTLTDVTVGAIDDIPAANAKGGIAPAEAFAIHRERLTSDADAYDPRVGFRIQMGENQSAADYIDTQQERSRIIAAASEVTRQFDAIVMPSVAILPPRLTDLAEDADYVRLNMLTLRNTSVGNFLDRCAISVPITAPGTAPVGLMLMGEHGADQKLFAVAEALASIVAES